MEYFLMMQKFKNDIVFLSPITDVKEKVSSWGSSLHFHKWVVHPTKMRLPPSSEQCLEN